jgi:hypothetical protein
MSKTETLQHSGINLRTAERYEELSAYTEETGTNHHHERVGVAAAA